jgi:hypothetical protein
MTSTCWILLQSDQFRIVLILTICGVDSQSGPCHLSPSPPAPFSCQRWLSCPCLLPQGHPAQPLPILALLPLSSIPRSSSLNLMLPCPSCPVICPPVLLPQSHVSLSLLPCHLSPGPPAPMSCYPVPPALSSVPRSSWFVFFSLSFSTVSGQNSLGFILNYFLLITGIEVLTVPPALSSVPRSSCSNLMLPCPSCPNLMLLCPSCPCHLPLGPPSPIPCYPGPPAPFTYPPAPAAAPAPCYPDPPTPVIYPWPLPGLLSPGLPTPVPPALL